MSRSSAIAAVMCVATLTACATAAQYGVEPTGPNTYKLHLTTNPGEREQRHAELARRASTLCGDAYLLTFHPDRGTVCTDACKMSETTVATLSCEAA